MRTTDTVTVSVEINRDKLIDDLPELIELITDLTDLVPDWSKLEAEETEEKIYLKLKSWIDVNQKR